MLKVISELNKSKTDKTNQTSTTKYLSKTMKQMENILSTRVMDLAHPMQANTSIQIGAAHNNTELKGKRTKIKKWNNKKNNKSSCVPKLLILSTKG